MDFDAFDVCERIVPSNENLQQRLQGRVTSLGYRSNEVQFAVQRAAVPEVLAALLQGLRSDAAVQSRCAIAFCTVTLVKDADFSLTATQKKSMGYASK